MCQEKKGLTDTVRKMMITKETITCDGLHPKLKRKFRGLSRDDVTKTLAYLNKRGELKRIRPGVYVKAHGPSVPQTVTVKGTLYSTRVRAGKLLVEIEVESLR